MTVSRSPEQIMALLERENRLRCGPVPKGLEGRAATPDRWQVTADEFLLHTSGGYGFHYRRGKGIALERREDADPAEEPLWLRGNVYAAVACINGLFPFHASAVAHEGRVFAFTGPAGMGKSTLAAGLARHGLSLFCDDTLLLDPDSPGRILCLPGHKRLKLTPEAVALTGAEEVGEVGAETGKLYARPSSGEVSDPLPLAMLVFLEDGENLAWSAIRGAERFARIEDEHYTRELYLAVRRPQRAELFALQTRIAANVAMARLVRPRSREGFAASVDLVAERIVCWQEG